MKYIFQIVLTAFFIVSSSYGMNRDSLIKSFQELINAIKSGRFEEVKDLCTNSRLVNLSYKGGITPLHIAVLCGDKEIVELLLKAGAKVTGLTIDNKDIFFFAMLKDNKDILELLLRAHEKVNSKFGYNEFTLCWAAKYNYKTIVELLLEAHVIFNTTNSVTPLHNAALNGCSEIVTMLIKAGINVDAEDPKGITPLMLAAEHGNKDVVQILLHHKANVNVQAKNDYKSIALHLAAYNGHKDIVALLLEAGARINEKCANNATAIQLASQMEHKDVVLVLLGAGADVSTYTVGEQFSVLHWAAQHGWNDVVELLLKKNIDINIKNSNYITPLHTAVYKGHSSMVELLLNNNADVNAKPIDTTTPIKCAVSQGHRIIVEMLLSFNAQIPRSILFETIFAQAKTNQGQLSRARTFKTIASVLSRGAYASSSIKAQVDLKRQELLDAVKQDNSVKVVTLLKEGFSLHTCGKDGNTLLHLAIIHKSSTVLKLLLSLYSTEDNQKLWSQRNTLNITPVEAAVAAGNVKLLTKLLASKTIESDTNSQKNSQNNQE